jgi:hypothetical protein
LLAPPRCWCAYSGHLPLGAPTRRVERAKAKAIKQEARSKKQEAGSKKQEARSKKTKAKALALALAKVSGSVLKI